MIAESRPEEKEMMPWLQILVYAYNGNFENELAGRSIEEQRRCFAFTEYSWPSDVPYFEVENEIRQKEYYLKGTHAISDRWSVIVKDGMIVGVAYNKYGENWRIVGKTPILPYQGYVYDSNSDNNGSGYKKRDWYKYLICLPYNHTLW